MPGAAPGGLGGSGSKDAIPALVLRCRTPYLLATGGTAAVLLGLGAASLASGGSEGPIFAVVLFAAGGLTVHLFLRYGLAALELRDDGFRLRGPLAAAVVVGWREARAWKRSSFPFGPDLLRIETRQQRVTIPLVYEDAHLLELGLQQGGFPVW